MEEARAWPHPGGVKTWAGQMPWAASPWIIGAVSVYALPGSKEGAWYIVCVDESGGKKSHDTLSHVFSLSHIHSGGTLAQITGLQWCCLLLRPLKMCSSEMTLAGKKKRVGETWEIFTSLFHISENRSAKEAWPNPCDCDFMDKHLSSATLELCCHHKHVGGKCLHQSMRKSRNSNILPHLTQNSERFGFSVQFDMVEVAMKTISVYFIPQTSREFDSLCCDRVLQYKH